MIIGLILTIIAVVLHHRSSIFPSWTTGLLIFFIIGLFIMFVGFLMFAISFIAWAISSPLEIDEPQIQASRVSQVEIIPDVPEETLIPRRTSKRVPPPIVEPLLPPPPTVKPPPPPPRARNIQKERLLKAIEEKGLVKDPRTGAYIHATDLKKICEAMPYYDLLIAMKDEVYFNNCYDVLDRRSKTESLNPKLLK